VMAPLADWPALSRWLIDTFLITGVLIAAVLLLRRPVSRHFGPQVAYALWTLPLLRLGLPPLVLPAWMAPSPEPLATATLPEPLLVLVTASPPAPAAQPGGVLDLLVVLWLLGGALFLAWRAHGYLAMRRELLAQARPVGEACGVRLVETPAIASPLAFGVFDKVVALPPLFMAQLDREARDLAIAHELAHHRGHDLVANIAAQPLLALHWFNPLAWAGWRAMRRDQEAACDARVVAGQGRTTRALYASVIADFAAGGSRSALAPSVAAPMACPVLGEKSIIHRLRSLASAEVPSRRRRAGLLAVGAAALGLPLTASISYAQPSPSEPPEAPEAHAAPHAPLPPGAPRPREAVDPDLHLGHDGAGVEEIERHASMAVGHHRLDESAGGWPALEEISRIMDREFGDDHSAQMAEHARALAEMDHAFAERDRALAEAAHAGEQARAHVRLAMREVPQITSQAHCEGDEPVIERQLADGRRAIIICPSQINDSAQNGLREARRAIEHNAQIPTEQRQELIELLDEQIEEMAAEQIEEALEQHLSLSVRYELRAPMLPRAAMFVPAALVRSAPSLKAALPVLRVEECEKPATIA